LEERSSSTLSHTWNVSGKNTLDAVTEADYLAHGKAGLRPPGCAKSPRPERLPGVALSPS